MTFRRVEQDAAVGFAEHGRVVVGITGSDDLEVQFLEALDRFAFLVRHAQVVIDQHAFGVVFQRMAEQRRPAQLTHQRMGEFVESVRQDDDLVILAQLVEESASARHRAHFSDHLLDVRQAELVLAQDVEAESHQRVVIRLFARRPHQLGNTRALGKFDPDFGDEDPFEV